MPSPFPPQLVHNGRPRAVSEGLVTASDGIVLRGGGAFEAIAAYRGHPFLATAHLDRLRRAANALDLCCPADEVLLGAMKTALEINALTDAEKARLRITLSSPADGGESWWVEASPPPSHRETAKVITGEFVRNERSPLAGLKTVNCGENVVAQRFAREAGVDEVLFTNTRDELCEGTWSNVFVLLDGRWLTPPLESGCLPGVTRALVIELFRELGHVVSESTLSLREVDRVESAFLTSSLREIQPISAIDGRELILAPELERLRGVYRTRTAAA